MVREYEMATEKIQRIGKLNDWIARQRSEKPEDKCALSRMEPVVWSGQAVRYATAVDGQRDDGLRDGQGGGDGGKGRRGDQAGGRLQLRLRLRPLRESTRKSTSPTPSITPPIPRPNLSPPALRNLYKSRTADHPANLLFFPPKTSPARPASRTSLVFSSLFLLFSHTSLAAVENTIVFVYGILSRVLRNCPTFVLASSCCASLQHVAALSGRSHTRNLALSISF